MQDLRTLFINMHHILNEYRPHQARESAIEMMQDHLDRTRTETLSIRTQVDKAKRVLEGLGSMGVGANGAAISGSTGSDAVMHTDELKQDLQAANGAPIVTGREKQLWDSVDDLFP